LRSDRAAWANGTKKFTGEDEYLLYIGCLGSYDENGRIMARCLVDILNASDVSFGILGEEEECCGNEVHMLGEQGLFENLAEKNTRKFEELGVSKVITLCPHGYNTMKNTYPASGGNLEVYHYTQILNDLMRRSTIKPRETKARVTYQDPCFLGRYNNIYEEPRQILQNIVGVELVEMERNRRDAFCCGGGSGNFVADLLAGSADSPARVRAREAYETGADTLAVACPSCLTMLTDAVKAENLDDELAVKDISQILQELLPVK
jgi:Fe-S oxidoreductase